MLRAGSAVVGIWNEAFDLDGLPAKKGTTVDGVERVVKAGAVRERNHRQAHDDGATKQAPNDSLKPLPGEPGIPSVAPAVAPQCVEEGAADSRAAGPVVHRAVCALVPAILRGREEGRRRHLEACRRPPGGGVRRTEEARHVAYRPAPVAASGAASTLRVPAIVPTEDELAEPIGVRRTGQSAAASSGPKAIPPEDAPAVLVSQPACDPPHRMARPPCRARDTSSRGDPLGPDPPQPRRLPAPAAGPARHADQDDRGRDRTQPPAGAPIGTNPPFGLAPAGGRPPLGAPRRGGLFGGQLPGSATPRVSARMLGDRSLVLPKGTAFTCALKTKVVSAASGLVGCQVQRNVYSDDGRVLLIERGSHMDGEYRIASVRPGTVRIPVVWTRIRTPHGVTVDIDSPGTGQLGESGIDGYVDNRWLERIGAALLLSLIDDSVQLAIQHETQRLARQRGRAAVDHEHGQQARREGARQHDQHPAADLPEPGRHRRHLRRPRRRLLVGLRAAARRGSDMTWDDLSSKERRAWEGDATSVIEFLRPLREYLDAPGVLEVCVNRPRTAIRDRSRLAHRAGAGPVARTLPVVGDRRRDLFGSAGQPGTAPPFGDPAERRTNPGRDPAGRDARHGLDHDPQALRSRQATRRFRT